MNDRSLDPADRELELLKLRVDVWKKAVDVQEHFNDIGLRLRSIAISVLVGSLGAAALAARERYHALAIAVLAAGATGWGAFFLMDRFWYHVFLQAAGLHAGEIEKGLKDVLPETGISSAISAASGNVVIPRWWIFKERTASSTVRLVLFYKIGFGILLFMAFTVVLNAAWPPYLVERLSEFIARVAFEYRSLK